MEPIIICGQCPQKPCSTEKAQCVFVGFGQDFGQCKPWREAPPFPLPEKKCDVIMHTLWERLYESHCSFVTFLASWKKKDDQDSAPLQAKIVCIASERSIVCTIGFIYVQFCCPGTRGDILLRRGPSNRPLMLLIRKLFL